MAQAGGANQQHMQPSTLGEFIQEYIREQKLSNRELADKLGVSHSVVNRLSWHGLRESYGNTVIGDPSLELLVKMALVTNTDICVLASLVAPQAVKTATRDALVLADRITRLDPKRQDLILDFIRGALFQQGDQTT